MTRIEVAVSTSEERPGYINVLPLVPVYSKELKDFLAYSSMSPDGDYSIFPGDKLENLLNRDETFTCEIPVTFFGTEEDLVIFN